MFFYASFGQKRASSAVRFSIILLTFSLCFLALSGRRRTQNLSSNIISCKTHQKRIENHWFWVSARRLGWLWGPPGMPLSGPGELKEGMKIQKNASSCFSWWFAGFRKCVHSHREKWGFWKYDLLNTWPLLFSKFSMFLSTVSFVSEHFLSLHAYEN